MHLRNVIQICFWILLLLPISLYGEEQGQHDVMLKNIPKEIDLSKLNITGIPGLGGAPAAPPAEAAGGEDSGGVVVIGRDGYSSKANNGQEPVDGVVRRLAR